MANWYVSKNGNNSTGRDWTNAWNELNQIAWASINPGDTIYLDGGSAGMTYFTTLAPNKDGTAGHPITIQLSPEANHNFQVVIKGGRNMDLPYYDQSNWGGSNGPLNQNGISLERGGSGCKYITIEGTKRYGITVRRWTLSGIRMYRGCSNCTIRNVEVYDCGNAIQASSDYTSNGVTCYAGHWYADGAGIYFTGDNTLIENCIIHDCGQDCVKTHYTVTGFNGVTVRRCWFYNGRTRPQGDIWNWISHNDGIQITAGNANPTVNTNMLVDTCVIGPGLSSGMIMGDPGSSTRTNDLTIQDCLFYGTGSNAGPQLQVGQNVHDGDGPIPTGWLVQNCTFDHPEFNNTNFEFNYTTVTSSNLQVINSLFTGWNCYINPTCGYSGNYRYNCEGPGTYLATNLVSNPYVTPGVQGSNSTTSDYTVSASSPAYGKGSSVTSSTALLALIDANNEQAGPRRVPQPANRRNL